MDGRRPGLRPRPDERASDGPAPSRHPEPLDVGEPRTAAGGMAGYPAIEEYPLLCEGMLRHLSFARSCPERPRLHLIRTRIHQCLESELPTS
jgi:hypothetical protein